MKRGYTIQEEGVHFVKRGIVSRGGGTFVKRGYTLQEEVVPHLEAGGSYGGYTFSRRGYFC